MKRLTTGIILSILLVFLMVTGVSAQTYFFSVPNASLDAYYNSDGTLSLLYTYTFQNDVSASPIEYVDIGLPNGNFNLSNISATVDGKVVTDISQADPQNLNGSSNGFTLALHENAIQPGDTGTVMAQVNGITGVFYRYAKGETTDYASVRITPNYFGSQYVTGSTNYRVSLHLPQGILPEEPQYEQQTSWGGPTDPTPTLDNEGRVTYTWEYDQANVASVYEFAAAFPAKYIPADALQTGIQLSDAVISNLICLCIFGVFAGVFGLIIYAGVVGAKKRKLQYLPPKIAIEGHGIKRGLTSVEAAILMEQPMDKIMTMVMFGVIKKDAASVITREPLEVKVETQLPPGLQPYEIEFLAAIKTPAGRERQKLMQEVMINLVKTVSEKMKGFSRKETIAYYEDINKRAWAQVEAADTPEVKSQKYDEYMEWAMLDQGYQDRTRDTFRTGQVFAPIWWGRFDPTFHQTTAPSMPSTGSIIPGGSGKTTLNLPNLPGADFAASMVTGAQSFAGGVVGDITAFTSGITNKTNPPPPPSTYRGSGGGGGSSCACACACAGCACACAGGGR